MAELSEAVAQPSDAAQIKRSIKITVIGILVFIAVVLMLFMNKFLSPRIMSKQELSVNGAIVFDTPRLIKPFSLIDQQEAPFGVPQLEGKWTLVFFGFTHCPDICPMTLMQINNVYKKLDQNIRENTQVVLVSADPARDTPAKMAEYVAHFNPNFIGVTGDYLQIKRLADNLNVAFNKVVTGDDYTIDHSANIVLVNPRGHYHGFYRPPFELARLKGVHQSIVSSF